MRVRDLELLDKEFKPYAYNILGLIQAHNLPFRVFETLRTKERQEALVKKGRSRTLKSKHIEGKAVDFVLYIDGKWSWDHKFYYDFLGHLVEKELGDHVKWGGRFNNFYDGVHYQLKA